MRKLIAAGLFSFLLLASCSTTKDENPSHSISENKTSEIVKSKTETAKSNKLNACEILPIAEVEKTLRQTVKSADLSRVIEGTTETAAFSQCSYKTGNGQTVDFFARRSPVDDNTPEAIQTVRETMKKVMRKDAEDVSGVGDTAFWVSGINQLHVFTGGNVYLYFTMQDFKNADEAKAKSAELAHQATKALLP